MKMKGADEMVHLQRIDQEDRPTRFTNVLRDKIAPPVRGWLEKGNKRKTIKNAP